MLLKLNLHSNLSMHKYYIQEIVAVGVVVVEMVSLKEHQIGRKGKLSSREEEEAKEVKVVKVAAAADRRRARRTFFLRIMLV